MSYVHIFEETHVLTFVLSSQQAEVNPKQGAQVSSLSTQPAGQTQPAAYFYRLRLVFTDEHLQLIS